MNNLVSIVTPLYNSEKYISTCIESVLHQTYSNWEIIIVDDSSTDNSVSFVKSFNDNRIKLILLKKNMGAGYARNNAINKANGKYIAFLDADDIWCPEKLEKQIHFMENNSVEFSFSSYGFIDEVGNKDDKYIEALPFVDYNIMLRNNYIGCLTAIYNQESLGKVYMPEFRKRQDWGLWLNLLKLTENAVSVPEVLAYYRKGNDSLSKNKIKLLKSNYTFYHQYLEFSVLRALFQMIIFLYFFAKQKNKKTNTI